MNHTIRDSRTPGTAHATGERLRLRRVSGRVAGLGVVAALIAGCGGSGGDADTSTTDTAADSSAIVDTAPVSDTQTTVDTTSVEDAGAPDVTVPPDTACLPSCGGRDCGDDGCGGSCGGCGADAACEGGACVAAVKYCGAPCTQVSDCLAPDPPPGYGAENFACVGGACHYTGCASNADCAVTNTVGGSGTCESVGGGWDLCVASCTTPADCATKSGVTAFDADNYTCEGGHCRYQGCNSDGECSGSFQDATYGCNDALAYPICMKRCTSPASCVVPNSSPLYDASHYACEAGYCRYTGCRSTSECAGAGLAGYLCVVP